MSQEQTATRCLPPRAHRGILAWCLVGLVTGCSVHLEDIGDFAFNDTGPIDADDAWEGADGVVSGCDGCSTESSACVSRSQQSCAEHEDLCVPLQRQVSLSDLTGITVLVDPTITFRLIDDGPFLLGCEEEYDDHCQSDEEPMHEIMMGAFYIQQTEVTVGQYASCVDAFDGSTRGCNPANFKERDARHLTCNYVSSPIGVADVNLPMNCINRQGAEDFCRFITGRLATEAQWEKAARGGCERWDELSDVDRCEPRALSPCDNPLYPWGNEEPACDDVCWSLDDSLCTLRLRACDAGSHAFDRSFYEVLDMAGNVAEWVSDDFSSDAYQGLEDGDICPTWSDTTSQRNSILGVVRGGSWQTADPSDLRVSQRRSEFAYRTGDSELRPDTGFRCVLDLAR